MNRLRAATDRVMSAKQARDYIECPVSANEREDVLALVRWFRRRYATPAARLAYVRRAYARWRLPAGSRATSDAGQALAPERLRHSDPG